MNEIPKPVVLLIIDGWGMRVEKEGNAYLLAARPNFTKLFAGFPNTQLIASEESVGLPHSQAGNSEVGHLNLGAGRIVYQEVLRINRSIADGTFWTNQAFSKAVDHIQKKSSNLHLLGLVSAGGVHSLLEHLYALLWFCKEKNLPKNRVKIHVITDGRDSPPTSAITYLKELNQKIESLGIGEIATVMGRFYAMDRDNRWERTKLAYEALTDGAGAKAQSGQAAIEASYSKNVTDEFIKPTVIVDKSGMPLGKIEEKDAVIFFNFRPDRARQLTKAFVVDDFATIEAAKSAIIGHETLEAARLPTQKITRMKTFERKVYLPKLFFVSFTEYEKDLPVSAIAFPPQKVELPLARVISEKNLRQFHIAETEKYPHVTYFFNGGHEIPYSGEDRLMVPSPKVATYDLKPEMSAGKITQVLLEKLNLGFYDFVVCNFANFDMVAHTGNLVAAIRAVEAVDKFVGEIMVRTLNLGGALFVTSDHGNCEEMINHETGNVDTEHNKNPVPVILCWAKLRGKKYLKPGILADVAPTILDIMGIQKPETMTGVSLLG